MQSSKELLDTALNRATPRANRARDVEDERAG